MESAFRNTWTRFLLPVVVLALLTGTVWAQGAGEIAGLVTDPTGAVISGATVTLTNSATGERRTTITAGTGNYRFPELPVVGTYAVSVSPKGFKSTKIQGIVVSVGITANADLKLELGAASEQVTVEASAETVQTTESSVSQLVDRNIWQSMPLEVRNQNSFIDLVAGAVPSGDDNGNGRGAAVNGTREGAGSYLVEGADNNEQGQAGRGQLSAYDKGGASTSISPDAIQEYRVITNSFSAEYGKGGGFITDTVLKSGTNKWHGSLFEYNRIQALAANDWFSNNAEVKDRLVRNQFGGSIGGPIYKDKTFFYATAELHRVRQTSPSAVVSATTQQFLDFVNSGQLETWAESDPAGICMQNLGIACPGAFGPHDYGAGTVTGASTLGPNFVGERALPGQHYPLATQNLSYISKGVFSAGLTYPVPIYGDLTLADPQSQNETRVSVKFDHRFSDNDSVSVVYLNQKAIYTDQYAGGDNTIGPAYTQDGMGQNAAVTWNHSFTPTLLNTFRLGFLRHRQNFPATLGGTTYITATGDVGVDLGNYTGLPQFFTENQFQYQDTMALQKGKHAIKFGGEYRRTRNGSSFFNDTFGTVAPYTVEDTLTDLAFTDQAENVLFGTHYYGGASYMSAAVDTTNSKAPDVYRGFRANEFAAFVTDDFRVNRKLTLNLGLRWEYFGPPHNFKKNIDSNYYFGVPVTPFTCGGGPCLNQFMPVNSTAYAMQVTGSFQVRNASIWNKDTNNFGPRFGFAYDLLGNQKLVVRGGFGIMYDRIYNNVFENIRFNPPFFSDNVFGGVGPIATPGVFTFPFNDSSRAIFNGAGAVKPLPNPRHMDQNIVTPYYEQAHFGLQWEFLKGYVFEPEYVGTFGHKLIGLRDMNTFDGRTAFGGENSTCTDPTIQIWCRPNPNMAADNFRNNGFASNYHGLQLSLRKNYSSGLGVNFNYTYSKAMDTLSDLFNNRTTAGRPTDGQNLHYDYAPADFNRKHLISGTVSYELPFMKQNRWIGGWGANAIISRHSGVPFSPYSSSSTYDPNKDGLKTDRLVPTIAPQSTVIHGNPAEGYFVKADWQKYTCPSSVNGGLWCDPPIGRNSITGPGFSNVDFSATKKFKITERAALQFQANFFDVFNHPNFEAPTSQFSSGTFGRSTLTLGDSGGHRVTQLAVRFDF